MAFSLHASYHFSVVILSLSLFSCHCFAIIITTTSVGLIQPRHIKNNNRGADTDLLLLVFMVMKFVYLASIAFFLLHAPDLFDNIQMFLVNLICFSDKLQIFLQHIFKKNATYIKQNATYIQTNRCRTFFWRGTLHFFAGLNLFFSTNLGFFGRLHSIF